LLLNYLSLLKHCLCSSSKKENRKQKCNEAIKKTKKTGKTTAKKKTAKKNTTPIKKALANYFLFFNDSDILIDN